ncbi:MAG: D-sedoheptulose-7-phosphate isomerase [Pseudomonadota bacterium]|jgi:D-sedoheptulose 7-phosphate isomerase
MTEVNDDKATAAKTAHAALGGLYPHLAARSAPGDDAREALRLEAALRDAMVAKWRDSVAVKSRFFESRGGDVLRAAHLLADSFRAGGRLYTMGNGGSSCDAAHVAVEFQHPVTAGRPALPAHNLAQDMAMLTAVGNDVGFAEVFARQMPGLLRPGDVALGVSTSGNAANVLRGLEAAHELGARTLALVGGDGGATARSPCVELCLRVDSDSIHRIQETHVAIYHVLWDLVHSLLADDRPARAAAPKRRSK